MVGPNGSGKSNVVDALAWVMGEQGAKTLRGGKMEDVIFAGTTGRPPLGRAEVTLTIDNSDGALPIEYAEVTISRTLFRNGGSEYAINGTKCRLLDIQDLLSDSGLGREMHVIVGQGQLDAILQATPEERRGFIEEAAGVLKHRKRKEKALRKLESMQGNLTRLSDLASEIRRQLGPLGKQAQVARRAQTIQSDLRDAKARLLADDLTQLTATFAQEVADETALQEEQQSAQQNVTRSRVALTELEEQAGAAATELSQASETWYRLSSLRERLRGTQTLARERVRLLGSAPEAQQRSDPNDLEAQAARVRAAEEELNREVELARTALTAAVAFREQTEQQANEAERDVATLLRGAADKREGLARLAGKVSARRSRIEATEAELERLREAVAQASQRGTADQTTFDELASKAVGAEEGEAGLDAAHESATATLEEAQAASQEIRAEIDTAARTKATMRTRIDTLELSLLRKDAAGAILAHSGDDDLRGVLGSVAALMTVSPGFEDAVAAALGQAADALAVESVDTAVDVVRWLRMQDAGRATLVIGTEGNDVVPRAEVPLPAPARWALDVVKTTEALRGAIAHLLTDVVIVDDLAAARKLVREHPTLLAVTSTGDVLGRSRAWGGSASAPSVLHLQSALDEAKSELETATADGARLAQTLTSAEAAERQAHSGFEKTLADLNQSDAAIAAVAEQLGHLGASVRSAAAEAERATAALERAAGTLTAEQEELAALVQRLQIAEAEPLETQEATEAATLRRDALRQEAATARSREMESRLTLRTSEERARALAGRADSLDRAAVTERKATLEAEHRAARRAEQSARALAVASGAAIVLAALDQSLHAAHAAREVAETARVDRDATIRELRTEVESSAARLRELTDVAHRDELARAEQQLRIEQLELRAVDELGLNPAVLLSEYGPEQPVPVADEGIPSTPGLQDPTAEPNDGQGPRTMPYVREQQVKRLRAAERAMSLLGRVNPLALEEFAALEERHKFLTDQLADLKKSRTDLMEIVRQIDERVEQVFTAAYHDTAEQFVEVFARLFPGGEGRLVLTDPGDMLTTGIEIEARPAGKKVKRLSLLSGGERSLTAVALLVSIFKARPSPFYVMDEVEAALDDVNLGRLLEIFVELQRDSQLIVITHQKRTMEIADALYGATMRGDGVTTLISQRLREDTRA